MCSAQGMRFFLESHGVGGLGPVEVPEIKEAPDATGGPIPAGGLTLWKEEGTIGMGNLGRIGRRATVPAPPTPSPPGSVPVLSEVKLVHSKLGRGGRSDGVARFTAPVGNPLVLEVVANVPGHRWEIAVEQSADREVGFWVRCIEGQPRRVVEWSFKMRDAEGRKSNSVTAAIECTGEALPGTAPRLESVNFQDAQLVRGWKSEGTARYTGTHPPLALIARSDPPGEGWQSGPRQSSKVRHTFSQPCGIWRFSVRDTFGRESNVLEKTIRCGACVKPGPSPRGI